MSPLASAMLGDQQRMPPLASMVMANPVGTERIDQSLTNPTPGFQPAVDWGGYTVSRPMYDTAHAAINNAMGWMAPIKAFHGSPYDFSAFDMSKIGTGEGAQAYGHGLYFAGNEGVAAGYKSRLAPLGTLAQGADGPQGIAARILGSGATPEQAIAELEGRAAAPHLNDLSTTDAEAFRQKMRDAAEFIRNPNSAGRMYEVNLNVAPEQLLDWDKPLSQQSADVRRGLGRATSNVGLGNLRDFVGQLNEGKQPMAQVTGGGLHEAIADRIGGYGNPNPPVTDALNQAGIPGIQYLDAGSRAAGDGTRNYVMFNPNLIDIVRKYGLAGAMLGAPTAAPFMQMQEPQQ